jgi:lysophospholipase L1-like esterase
MINRRSFLRNSLAGMSIGLYYNTFACYRNPISYKVAGYNYLLPIGSRILFQGDSITDMNWGRDQTDRNHYLGHSYVFLIAARLGVEMPQLMLDIYNRGISANMISDLRKRWKRDAMDINPDLLSILIGINDIEAGVEPESFEADYRYILDTSRKANPELRIVLLDPFVLRSGRLIEQNAWQTRRASVDRFCVVLEGLAEDYDAVHIKTQNIFDIAADEYTPEHWIWDGVHPLPQGHELIARNWLQEVSARWPYP